LTSRPHLSIMVRLFNGKVFIGGMKISKTTKFSIGLVIIIALVGVSTGFALDGDIRGGRIEVTPASSTDGYVLVGAGDIAGCGSQKDEETAALLDKIPGTVFTAGDNVYPDGAQSEFEDCYDPTWGRHKARTYPSPGNHDYHTNNASGYYNYFGDAAGNPGEGYYSYDLGAWHIVALNSECSEAGGCDLDSPQAQWLQADLEAHATTCTLAYWHHPMFSSDAPHGNSSRMQDYWTLLYDAGADVVVNGHAHTYERFAPQDPEGKADPEGIREFVVGTGGAGLYDFGTIQPNSEVRNNETHGVLKLTLHAYSYAWEFIPTEGGTFTDSGSARCSGAPTGNTPPEAIDDTFIAGKDEQNTITLPGVLGNDDDPDGDPLAAILVSDVSHGDLSLHTDGSFDYTPSPGFEGTDSFTYQASDGVADSSVATVTIEVVELMKVFVPVVLDH
jgi:hypothetical protein